MKLGQILHRLLHPFSDNSDIIHGVPLDKLQLDAAQDRLEQRSKELKEESDKLTKMIKRMKRERRQ